MNLIDRYVYAVCRSLPQKQRADIEKELRSLIEDMLQQRTGGRPAEEADIEAVLLELGNPMKLADSYRGNARYLISPSYFDIYWLVLRIALAGVTLGIAVSFIVRAAMNPPDMPWQAAGDFLGSLCNALVGAFGMTTLIFAIIEHFAGNAPSGIRSGEDKWKPKDLPPIPASKMRIPKSEPIVGMIFILVFTLIINIDSNLIGLYINGTGEMLITPLLSESFRTFLPWINISLAASFILEAIKLFSGRWNLGIILGSIPQKILGLVIGIRMFADTSIFNPDFFKKINEVFAQAGKPITAALPDKICQVMTIIVIAAFILDMLTLAVKSLKLAFGKSTAGEEK